MTHGVRTLKTKMTRGLASAAIAAVVAFCSLPAQAAPFTPGNLVILTAPVHFCAGSPSSWPEQITLKEYTQSGNPNIWTLVQSIPLPTSGALFGLANGSA